MSNRTSLKHITGLIIIWLAWKLISGNALAQFGVQVNASPEIAKLIENEQYAEAEALVKTSTNVDDRLVAWLELMQGHHSAVSNLIEFASTSSDTNRAQSLIDSILIAADASADSGIQIAKEKLAMQQWRDEPRLKLVLASLYLKTKKISLATPLIDEVVATHYTGPDLKNALFKQILLYYELGQAEQALKSFNVLFEKEPSTKLDPGFQMQWCHIASAAGRQAEVLAKLDELQTIYPNYYAPNEPLFHIAKANAYESMGDTNHADREWHFLVNKRSQFPQFAGLADLADGKLTEKAKREHLLEAANTKALRLSDASAGNIEGRRSSFIPQLVLSAVLLSGVCIFIGLYKHRHGKKF